MSSSSQTQRLFNFQQGGQRPKIAASVPSQGGLVSQGRDVAPPSSLGASQLQQQGGTVESATSQPPRFSFARLQNPLGPVFNASTEPSTVPAGMRATSATTGEIGGANLSNGNAAVNFAKKSFKSVKDVVKGTYARCGPWGLLAALCLGSVVYGWMTPSGPSGANIMGVNTGGPASGGNGGGGGGGYLPWNWNWNGGNGGGGFSWPWSWWNGGGGGGNNAQYPNPNYPNGGGGGANWPPNGQYLPNGGANLPNGGANLPWNGNNNNANNANYNGGGGSGWNFPFWNNHHSNPNPSPNPNYNRPHQDFGIGNAFGVPVHQIGGGPPASAFRGITCEYACDEGCEQNLETCECACGMGMGSQWNAQGAPEEYQTTNERAWGGGYGYGYQGPNGGGSGLSSLVITMIVVLAIAGCCTFCRKPRRC